MLKIFTVTFPFFALPYLFCRFGANTPIGQMLAPWVAGTWLVCGLSMVGFTVATSRNERIGWNDAAFWCAGGSFSQFGIHGCAAAGRSGGRADDSDDDD